MAETLTQFTESLGAAGGFQAGCIFQQEADLLTVHFEQAPHYADRVDKFLTVYKSFDGDNLVGFELKGIRHKIEEMLKTLKPDTAETTAVNVNVKCEPHINLLLTFYMKDALGSGSRETYQRVYEKAGSNSDLRIPPELVNA